MKWHVLVNPGLEETASQEISEILKINSTYSKGIVKFEASKEEAIRYAIHAQSIQRILASVNHWKDKVHFDSSFSWEDFLTNNTSCKIEVEGVKGQDNRTKISREVLSELSPILKEKKINLKLDMKKPDVLIIIYFDGEEYFAGIDITGKDLAGRDYRVFPHPASFKGDSGYFFIRFSKFQREEKILVGLMRDGMLAIEATLFSTGLPVHLNANKWAFWKFPCSNGISIQESPSPSLLQTSKVEAFDQGTQNFTAARKNAAIAGAKNSMEIHKFGLDELDVKFEEGEFDRLIFHVTKKDEALLNEIYYQAKYLLKKGGTLLFIGRDTWELTISDKFSLIKEGYVQKGDNVHKCWLLEKN
ncbi:MAG: THUMP domain-containing protein [archaeon]|nr:THUMP domain-containing protein [archaeon]